ncbi:putative oxidoreductase YtbE [Mytilus galloprovincialis]|uniref:putative oxidoreductase YtbE n=1 Tax=Mytilus galloprovincialis TaxID=29158 RepID=UPI003F7C69E4
MSNLSVGVSNFNIHHLEGLGNAGLPTPSVNQIELHPWLQPREIIDYCKKYNITVMGYSPLVKSKMLKNQQICDLAKRYNKTTAQILIRWSVQHGYITIPKSSKPNRIKENMQVFDWTLSEDDMDYLDQNNVEEIRCGWDAINSEWHG